MKTILLLHDEATQPTQLLRNALPVKFPVRETEAVAGCNCDRWGHPCPGCVEQKHGQCTPVQDLANKEQR